MRGLNAHRNLKADPALPTALTGDDTRVPCGAEVVVTSPLPINCSTCWPLLVYLDGLGKDGSCE